VVVEPQALALVGRDSLEGALESVVGRGSLVMSRADRDEQFAAIGEPGERDLADRSSAAAAHRRPRRVHDDATEPRREQIGVPEGRKVTPGLDEDRLRRVPGVRLVAEDRQHRPECRAEPGVDELGERVVVAVARSFYERPLQHIR